MVLSQKSEERQTFMAKQVVESMTGMSLLTDILSEKMAPSPGAVSSDLVYHNIECQNLELKHQEFDLEGKKNSQDSAQQEHDLRLKEQELLLEERKIMLAECWAAFHNHCANEWEDTMMKQANEFASIMACFISSGVSPHDAKALAEEAPSRFSQGDYFFHAT